MKYYDLGENHFEEPEVIRKEYLEVDYRDKQIEAGGLNIISDGKKAVIAHKDNNTIIIGSSGSKKSRDVNAPYIYSCVKAGENLIINDPKKELYKMVYKSMGKYDIKIIDFRNPEKSDKYNPYEYYSKIYHEDQGAAVEGFAEGGDSLSNEVHSETDVFWEKGASSMFTGYACILSMEYKYNPEMCNLHNICKLHLQGAGKFGGDTYMKAYFDDENSKAFEMLNTYINAAQETRKSLDAVFSGAISKYIANEKINEMISTKSSFEMPDLINNSEKANGKPFAIFISNKDESTLYNPIVTMIINQFYSQLIKKAQENGGALKRRCNFILDEFASSIGAIPYINNKFSTCRSRQIRFVISIQSLSQLRLVYGKEETEIILQNCNDWVYLNSNDPQLLKMVSERCGEVTDISGNTRKLVPVEKLVHLEKDNNGKTQALFLIGRNYPYFSYLPDIKEYYGIDILKKSNLRKKKAEILPELDFKEIVKEKKKQKLLKLMEEAKNDTTGELDDL